MNITTELGVQKITSFLSYFVSLFTALGSYFSDMDIGVLVGVVCALATALVNWIYQSKRNHREQALFEQKKQLLKKQMEKIETS